MVTLISKITETQQPPTLINDESNCEMFKRILQGKVEPNLPLRTQENIEIVYQLVKQHTATNWKMFRQGIVNPMVKKNNDQTRSCVDYADVQRSITLDRRPNLSSTISCDFLNNSMQLK